MGYSKRLEGVRVPIERFLIVCEGTRTEPNYFRSFRVARDVIDIHGCGGVALTVVKKTMQLKAGEDYDQVWCVFDRDNVRPVDFNEAISLAQRNDFKIAYSNEAFEIWYLLHFHYYCTAVSRSQYQTMLTRLLQFRYEKNSQDMYRVLKGRQQTAIANARTLLGVYSPCNPVADNPSTTVHLLVEQLNRFVRD